MSAFNGGKGDVGEAGHIFMMSLFQISVGPSDTSCANTLCSAVCIIITIIQSQ